MKFVIKGLEHYKTQNGYSICLEDK